MRKGVIDITTLEIVAGVLILLGLLIGAIYLWKPELFKQAITSVNNMINSIKI